MDWSQAECLNKPDGYTDREWVEVFFPPAPGGPGGDNHKLYEPARVVCRRCPIQVDCAFYAIEHRIRFGVWGGLSENDRFLDRPNFVRRREQVLGGRYKAAGRLRVPEIARRPPAGL